MGIDDNVFLCLTYSFLIYVHLIKYTFVRVKFVKQTLMKEMSF